MAVPGPAGHIGGKTYAMIRLLIDEISAGKHDRILIVAPDGHRQTARVVRGYMDHLIDYELIRKDHTVLITTLGAELWIVHWTSPIVNSFGRSNSTSPKERKRHKV